MKPIYSCEFDSSNVCTKFPIFLLKLVIENFGLPCMISNKPLSIISIIKVCPICNNLENNPSKNLSEYHL